MEPQQDFFLGLYNVSVFTFQDLWSFVHVEAMCRSVFGQMRLCMLSLGSQCADRVLPSELSPWMFLKQQKLEIITLIWVPQKLALRWGFESKWFIWKVIPENTFESREIMQEKEVSKEHVIKSDTTVGNRDPVLLVTSRRPTIQNMPQCFPVQGMRKLGYSTNSPLACLMQESNTSCRVTGAPNRMLLPTWER